MPDESERASRPWSMTFRVSGEPRCPGCCVALASVVITFHEGWAWCPVCSKAKLYAQVHLRWILQHDVMACTSLLRHGLRFYIPSLCEGQFLNALDQYERLISTPVPEPAAVAAWPGFDLVQLPQHVRDRDREPSIPWYREAHVPFGYEVAGIADDGRLVLLEIKSSEPA